MSGKRKIPMGWHWKKLGEICEVTGGGTPSRKVSRYFEGNIPWATPTDVTALSEKEIASTATSITQEAILRSSTKLLPGGCVLLASRATIGFTAINSVPMCTNQGFANFECGPEVLNFYLAYYLPFIKETLLQLASGATFKEINKTTLKEIEITLPPFAVQEQIVEVLQQADAIRRKRTEARRLADQILPALFLDMFGDPATNPKGWPMDKLGKVIAQWQAGFASGKKDAEGGVRQLRMNNITTSGWINLDLVRTVPRHKKHEIYLLGKGDVVFNNTNSPELVGKTILFLEEGDFYYSNHLSRIRTTDRVTNEWLAGLLHVLWAKDVFKGMCRQWVNQASVSKESVLNLDVPIPSPTALLNHREALEHLSSKRDGFAAASLVAESLFSILLSRAFTGELTAEWEAANAAWITERQMFYDRLPRLALLSLLLEQHRRAGRKAVTLITALMKYVFLAQMEGELRRRLYRFVPYHYGPCAMDLYNDLKALQADGLIAVDSNAEEDKTRIALTDPARTAALLEEEARKDDTRLAALEMAGEDTETAADPAMLRLLKRRAETLETLRADTATILDTYGNLDHNSLLKTVYERYPAYAIKSRVRKGRKSRPGK